MPRTVFETIVWFSYHLFPFFLVIMIIGHYTGEEICGHITPHEPNITGDSQTLIDDRSVFSQWMLCLVFILVQLHRFFAIFYFSSGFSLDPVVLRGVAIWAVKLACREAIVVGEVIILGVLLHGPGREVFLGRWLPPTSCIACRGHYLFETVKRAISLS